MRVPFYEKTVVKPTLSRTTPNQIIMRQVNPIREVKLSSLLESKGKYTPDVSFSFTDSPGECTIPHPDKNYDLYKKVAKKVGVVANAISNITNFAIQSGYELEGEEGAKQKIYDWIKATNFDLLLLKIMKEMLVYGNSYLEVSENYQNLKLLPAKQMYVVVHKGGSRDGDLKGYKQVVKIGDAISFDAEDIIHFKWNEIGNEFYGTSDLSSCLGIITDLLQMQKDIGTVIHNYGNPIMQHKLGTDENPATEAQVKSYEAMLKTRSPGEDLVTSSAVEITPVVANLKMLQPDGMIEHLENQLIAALGVPEIFVRGGKTSNKATADVELQAFDRKVKALQKVVAHTVEKQLFQKIANSEVKYSWHEMSVESEAIKAQMFSQLTMGGMPLPVAMQIVGWGSWVDDVERWQKENPGVTPSETKQGKENPTKASRKDETEEEEELDQFKQEYLDVVKSKLFK